MTFEEAVEVVKAFSPTGLLLDGLQFIQDDLAYCENDEDADYVVSQREIAAYRLVCAKMRPLFA